MFSLRSLFGLSLSILIHGSVGAYILSHDYKTEKPKPKKITMQLALFKIAPPPKQIANQAEPKPAAEMPSPTIKPPIKNSIKKEKTKPVRVEIPKPKLKKVVKKKIANVKAKPTKIAQKKIKLRKKSEKQKKPAAANKRVKKKVIKPKKKKYTKPIVKKILAKKSPIKKQQKTSRNEAHAVLQKRKAYLASLARKKQLQAQKSARAAAARKAKILAQKRAIATARKTTLHAQKKARIAAASHKARLQAQKNTKSKHPAIVKRTPAPVKRPKPIVKPKHPARPSPAKVASNNPHLEKQYEQGIRQRIEQRKVYPRRAKRMRKQGVVKVAFTINRNGIISKLRILKSSGVKSLDQAALKAVRKVGRFPAIPAGIRKQSLSYNIPISYHIR